MLHKLTVRVTANVNNVVIEDRRIACLNPKLRSNNVETEMFIAV